MAGSGHQSYVREFTRHAGDVLMNLNVLRKRQVLTDVTLRVGGCPLQAHKAVLTACSGFFYSIFLGQGGHEVDVLTLPSSIEPVGFQALLDFMYTSRLLLSPGTAPAILVAASYLQMEHVVQSCHRFIQTSSEQVTFLWAPPAPKSLCHQFQPLEGKGEWGGSLTASLPRWGHNAASKAALLPPASYPTKEQDSGPARSPGAGAQFPPGHPASPGESSSCAPMPPDPRACNWKKYRFIVLNSRLQVGQTEPHSNPAVLEGEAASRSQEGAPIARAPAVQAHCSACSQEPHSLHSTPPEDPSAEPGEACSPIGRGPPSCRACDLQGWAGGDLGTALPAGEKPYECHFCRSAVHCKGNLASHRALHSGEKPYHCGVCGAQFNRPANLKTHLRIHSGEKPYKCETCGSCFVQVAHLRAHVLIHTGEKPYPCGTCGTRFRHLQTLKSHIRIHTGEKPYHCEKCSVRFRHKSQLRLHLRQKHGAITNTKIRYHVLDGPRIPLC